MVKSNTECCYNVVNGSGKWNPYNRVVQCHSCGHIFVKASKFKYFLNRLYGWWK